MKISINIDPTDKILLKRSLNKHGKAEQYMTSEIRRLSDPYVPFDQGFLKNTAIEGKGYIEYQGPYARRQWHEHKGKGLRGREWVLRMWGDRGKEIVRSVAAFAGGKAK